MIGVGIAMIVLVVSGLHARPYSVVVGPLGVVAGVIGLVP